MTTDFFDREARAQKQTRRLVWLFGLTVLAVLIVNNLVLGSLVYIFRPAQNGFMIQAVYLLGEALAYPLHFLKLIGRPVPVICISVGTLLSIAAGCYYKIRQLSEGGSVIAELLGGRRVAAGTTDPGEQRLRNVIGEMAVAAATPAPEIYVLDNERGINTFAAGHTRDDMAIGVTRGALKLLTRDELQGVIAHEFSHILNGDTRLNMKLIGLAHGFFWPTMLGRALTYGSTDAQEVDASLFSDDDGPRMLPTAPLGFLFIILGSVSLPFVRLIKSAICRQREWLADAAAVQFTRNPAGIGGALKKIGGLFKQGRLDSPHAEVASHLYFVDSNFTPWMNFLATHPSLTKRVAAIDPTFNGIFAKITMLAPNQAEREQAFDTYLGNAMAVDRQLTGDNMALAAAFSAVQLRKVSLMRLNLPPAVKSALDSPAGAAAIIISLLLSEEESVRARQMEVLQNCLASETLAQITSLAAPIAALGDRYKLVLSEFAMPALREYNVFEHGAFHQTLQRLVECDGSMDLFEYMLMKMVARQLQAYFSSSEIARTQYGRVLDLLPECGVLLSALAYLGSDDEAAARIAFARGVEYLDAPYATVPFLTRGEWDLAKVDAALTQLAGHHEPLRRNVLMACSKVAIANDQITEREAELLRAIADSLDCPMPPVVEALLMDELTRQPANI